MTTATARRRPSTVVVLVLQGCLWLVVFFILGSIPTISSMAMVTERRRIVVRPWVVKEDSSHLPTSTSTPSTTDIIGWAVEEQTAAGDVTVTVGLGNPKDTKDPSSTSGGGHNEDENVRNEAPITVELIRKGKGDDNGKMDGDDDDDDDDDDNIVKDDLARTQWPAGIAGAILNRHFASISPNTNDLIDNRRVLELGSGLGLCGWTAAARARSVVITDHDQAVVQELQHLVDQGCNSNPTTEVSGRYLEWRDDPDPSLGRFDWIIGADVAYYFFLLRPLMDTIRAHLSEEAHARLLIVGQANRESQWNLYDNLVAGCYNQLTDEREPPWDGRTRMILYRMEMGRWTTTTDDVEESDDPGSDEEFVVDSSIPIAALLYERESGSVDFLGERDREATPQDRDEMLISF